MKTLLLLSILVSPTIVAMERPTKKQSMPDEVMGYSISPRKNSQDLQAAHSELVAIHMGYVVSKASKADEALSKTEEKKTQEHQTDSRKYSLKDEMEFRD